MGQIVDIHGNQIQHEVLDEPQTAKLGWITRDFAQHPGRRLTPQKLHRILEQAELGDLMAQSDLFNDMEERDTHLFAEMSKRRRALITIDRRVVPPKNASATEKKQAAQLAEWLDGMLNMDEVLFDCMDGVGHGFSAQEIEWTRLGTAWLPKALTHRPQRWFRTPLYDGNDLRLRDNSSNGQPLLPFGWLVHKHRAKSGYLTRGGLHRVLAWPFVFKMYASTDLAEFLEIYGMPIRIGQYQVGASDAEKAKLLRAVMEIGHNASGILPEGMKIEFQNAAAGQADPFQLMIQWCELCQSKAILGGTLTSQADGKTSTNALGKTHNEVRRDLLKSDASQVAESITRNLLYPLCALNFGLTNPSRMPRYEIDARESADVSMWATTLPPLIAAGFKVSREWAQDKLMIPEPADGEELLQIAKPEMTLPPSERADQRPPVGADPKKAVMRYRAVLTNSAGEIVYPDQHALDQTVDALPASPLVDALEPILRPAVVALSRGATPDEAAELLLEANAQMDSSQLEAMLARCLFVADLWGRLNAS